jgi:4-amino-4-deoxy-L-arabinose transferase-like glycosyltransferase
VRKTDAIALGLALIGGVASFLVADRVYERLPHLEDEFALLWEAEVMADGKVYLPSPEAPKSFSVPFVVDYDGQRFGKYPPGWPAALSLGARFEAPWMVNAILTGVSIWLTYRLASKIVSERLSLLAAALTLLSPMFLLLSGSLLSHTFSLFLTLAFVLAWLDMFGGVESDISDKGIPTWLLILVAGLCLGLLAITRPLTAVAVAIPFIIHGVVLWIKVGGGARKRLAAVGLLAVVMALLLPYWQAMLTGDPTRNLYTLWWEYDRIGIGPGIGVTDSGHNIYLAYWNTQWSLAVGIHDLFGWPYLSWIFLPFGLLALGRKFRGWLLFSLFPILVVVYGFYWVGSWLYGPRYYFESLPILAIISAAGIAWVGGWLGEVGKYVRARRMTVLALVMLLIVGNVVFYIPARMAMMSRLFDISRSHLETFEALGVESGLVIVHPIENWRDYGTLLTLTPPFADSDLILVISRVSGENETLIQSNSDRPIYHYYPDEPSILYDSAR